MNIEELYKSLRRVQDKGAIGNAYSGCGMIESADDDVLGDFYEYILEKYEPPMPLWAEAFVQIFSWQFQTIHECAEAYYGNFYGYTDYETIIRTAGYLRKNGYYELAEPYASAAMECERYQYPKDKAHLLPDEWIFNHDETVWNFYVDILEKHKEELLP